MAKRVTKFAFKAHVVVIYNFSAKVKNKKKKIKRTKIYYETKTCDAGLKL